MLSVIVPCFNRLENLKLCLAGLAYQKDAPDWQLIVVDDGSTDGLRESWHSLIDGVILQPSITGTRYYSGGPNKGFRGGRARNIGAFNCDGDRFVFVDSDVVLNEYALHHYEVAAIANPEAIIVGAYHWLPPLDWTGHEALLWNATRFDQLLRVAIESGVKQTTVDNDSPFGEDVRTKDFTDDVTAIMSGAGLGALSGNISYPRKLFYELGGFDERIVGHGGEDADLGLTADERQTQWLFYKPIFGFHLWHPRDQMKNSREVQANIAFIDAKHGVGQYAGAKKWTDSQDWSDPIHYHKHLGSSLIKVIDDSQVYVYREKHYLKLSSPAWLIKLGFKWVDLEIVQKEFLSDASHAGDTVEDATLVVEMPASTKVGDSAESTTRFDARQLINYRRENGTAALRTASDGTVYVVRDDMRVAISHPDWLQWLGFKYDDILIVPEHAFEGIKTIGATPNYEIVWTEKDANNVRCVG